MFLRRPDQFGGPQLDIVTRRVTYDFHTREILDDVDAMFEENGVNVKEFSQDPVPDAPRDIVIYFYFIGDHDQRVFVQPVMDQRGRIIESFEYDSSQAKVLRTFPTKNDERWWRTFKRETYDSCTNELIESLCKS